MSSENPYASPASDEPPLIEHLLPDAPGVWRRRRSVIVSRGAHFSPRCVKCNQPTGGRTLRRNLAWHPAWIYILILPGVVFYVIAGVLLRKTMTVWPGVCPMHLMRHNIRLAVGGGGIAFSIVVPIALGNLTRINPGLLIVVGVPATLGFTVFTLLAYRFVAPSKIDDDFAWIKNTGPEFRDSLPLWRAP